MINVIVKDGEKVVKDLSADITCVLTRDNNKKSGGTFVCGETSALGIASITRMAIQVLQNIEDKDFRQSAAIVLIKEIADGYLDEDGKYILMLELAKEKGKKS